jgi:hypothetical protein
MFTSDASPDEWVKLVALAITTGTCFLPAGLVALGHTFRSRFLRGLGGIWLVLVGLLWVLPGLFVLINSAAGLIPIAVGTLYFLSVGLMDSAAPD